MDDAGGHGETEGRVERVYWRGEEPWIRLRTRDGLRRPVPWRDTDLPPLASPAFPRAPRLSPQALLDLAPHLMRRDAPANSNIPKPLSD